MTTLEPRHVPSRQALVGLSRDPDPRDSFPFDCPECAAPTLHDGPCARCLEPLAVAAREAAECVLCGATAPGGGVCARHLTDPSTVEWMGGRQ